MTTEELQGKLLDEIQLRQTLANEYDAAKKMAALADHEYRKSKAIAITRIKLEEKKEDKLTDLIRGAMCDVQCELPRLRQRTTAAEVDGLYQRIQASAGAVSAYQSLLKLLIGEMDMEKFGQRMGA